jgi:thioredoxin:protein disulfide reductase
MMHILNKNLFIIAVLFFSIFTNCSFANEGKFLNVDDAFIPTLIQDNDKVTIEFKIAPNYYLYQERFKYKALNSSIKNVDIPEGVEHDDEYMGLSHIYHDNVKLTFLMAETQIFPQIQITFQGCTEGMCYPPTTKTFTIDKIVLSNIENNNNLVKQSETLPSKNSKDNESFSIYKQVKESSTLLGPLLFFVFGLFLSFTPCMFPMYPIWSAIILGDKKRNMKTAFMFSFTYIQGMAITFMMVGFAIAYVGAKFHSLMQQPIVLGSVSILFIILALSMFGLFTFALPSKLVNKLQDVANTQKGGSFIGVFLMGAISAAIASPCTTAPLTGALLFIVQDGDIVNGAINLYLMALGMGTPLFLIGMLGQKLLPKSGNWMNIIKVSCGFLMLGVPLFLLNQFLSAKLLYILSTILIASYISYLVLSTKKRWRVYISTIIMGIAIILSFTVSAKSDISLHANDIFTPINTNKELQNLTKNNDVVILDIYADWCRECIHLNQKTFTNKNVKKLLKQYITVSADVTDVDNPAYEITEKYNITGVPTVLIFKNNKLVYQIDGYLGPTDFIKEINKALN